MVVSVETEPTLQVGIPQMLFEGQYQNRVWMDGIQMYDVSPDCRRFVMIAGAEGTMSQLVVVLNWFEELKRLVPTGN